MFQNPTTGREARNSITKVPKILDLKSSSLQIYFFQNWRWVPCYKETKIIASLYLTKFDIKHKLQQNNSQGYWNEFREVKTEKGNITVTWILHRYQKCTEMECTVRWDACADNFAHTCCPLWFCYKKERKKKDKGQQDKIKLSNEVNRVVYGIYFVALNKFS